MAHGETYEEFVAKFNKEKPKTTDDCYTPREIYEVVLDWANEKLNIGDRPIVRPFYPGGDFENYDYPENCVVVDNPPFSIFAKILRWYNERGIKFFLFAPFLTSIREGVTLVCTDATITYDNGAYVKTGFATNMMGNLLCVTAPDLSTKIKETQRKLKNTPPREDIYSQGMSCALLRLKVWLDVKYHSAYHRKKAQSFLVLLAKKVENLELV